MLPLLNHSLLSQPDAALSMLHHAIATCPDDRFDEKIANDTFRQVAYHTLFYTDLYLSPTESHFHPRALHTQGGDERGPAPSPGLPKPETLAYVPDVHQKAIDILTAETESTLAGPPGFPWIPFPRLELHLYNLRHLRHHTGDLTAHLRRTLHLADSKSVPWVGYGWR